MVLLMQTLSTHLSAAYSFHLMHIQNILCLQFSIAYLIFFHYTKRNEKTPGIFT